MSKDRVLFIAADLPWPPDSGGRIATLRILEAYASLFVVDLVAIADPVGEPDPTHIRDICDQVTIVPHPFTFGRHPVRQLALAATSMLSPTPYRLRKFASKPLARAIAAQSAAHAYAIAHFDQFGVAPYHLTALPTTMAHHNVESDLYRRGAAQAGDPLSRLWLDRERDKLARSEATLLPAFDHVFALAGEDAELSRGLGIDRVSILPMPAPAPVPDRQPPIEHTILSLGSMGWFGVSAGLAWFGEHVFPLVQARVPDVRWRIVGAHAPRRIRTLARRRGIELLGHVDDLDKVVAKTRVGVVPLMVAGGIRMKLLDLMAWRVPTVATTLAARGLGFPDGHGVTRRDRPGGFADAVVALLTDDVQWLETERRGVEYINAHQRQPQLVSAISRGVEAAVEHHQQRERHRGV